MPVRACVYRKTVHTCLACNCLLIVVVVVCCCLLLHTTFLLLVTCHNELVNTFVIFMCTHMYTRKRLQMNVYKRARPTYIRVLCK